MIESSRSRTPRVVVTGIGLRTGLGPDAVSTWEGLRAGRSAARSLSSILPGHGGRWHGYPAHPANRRQTTPGENEVSEAVRDARLFEGERPNFDPDRAATVIGLSKGDIGRLARAHRHLHHGGPAALDAVDPDWTRCWPDAGARSAFESLGLRGPSIAPVAACATGLMAVLRAAELIRIGTCDLALAGATESSIEPLVLGAFARMRVLARVGEDPIAAVRPWDRARSGFLVGEGGAVLVLEREEHARHRGVLPYAEVLGGALGSGAGHETRLDPDPGRFAMLIAEAMTRCGVVPDEVDHVNVHGTATRDNDPLECRAIRRALGSHADGVSCSANKAQIGHLLGGSGAVELAITCLAIRDQFVPPTLNLTDPDPACDLDGTPGVGRYRPIGTALKFSIGFGGHLGVAVLRRPDGPRRPSVPMPPRPPRRSESP
ncbi:3-oxoacyl-[acyl-carrier-protein] synthase 2 [Tautonia plasticadhaerens]|uniref:3-oxoacyl-[acyl-carrier-protein] synthase 2 n=2 Tax=Tautonia plasticadhaerens TaxID=2527974 RepID=A0A518H8D8_9BACT|nr:3-oxoacyl-[acyl-carrier-protein] synthase 2 [Tautonia plasticadhaerens]